MQDLPKCILYELANIISNFLTLRTKALVFTQNHRLGQLVADEVRSG